MRVRAAWYAIAAAASATIMACQASKQPPPAAAAARPRTVAAGESLSSDVPSDLPPNPQQSDAAAYAWRSFVALNWPALRGRRGVPDTSKTIGQPGDVVWNTWKAPGEVFYADGRVPPPWSQYGETPPSLCTAAGAAAGDFVLHRITKVPGDTGSQALQRLRQAVGGTLTDQNGKLAHYEVRMNLPIFDSIVSSQLYNTQGQDAAASVSFPAGVMEIKAAWREMTANDSPSVKSRFFRRTAWIYTPFLGNRAAACVRGEVGLVGLHITQKTPTRPQWTWATFEHVDNVPPPASGWTGPFSFNNPSCLPAQCPPNTSTERNGVPTATPTQVVRLVQIGDAAAAANPVWQQALSTAVAGSPFQYYQLIDIQWPQNPAQLFGDPTPGLVSNSSMETYVQDSSSCLNCHFTARLVSGRLSSDYSFMLSEAKPATAARSGR